MCEIIVSETEPSKLMEVIAWALYQAHVKTCKLYLKSA